jgi:tRNA modification GTPase
MADGSTIFALSSGAGRAGIAVIRVSGPAAREVALRMAPPLAKPREAVFRAIRHPGTSEILDRAVVIVFDAARSETGEDVVELQVHGGRAVVRSVLDALATMPGCRIPEPGEFARRAFQNGKLDLAQVEGLADLVEAETEAQRRQAVAQSGGALSKLYEGWRLELIAILALAEAAIDFADEGDVGANAFATARERARPLVTAIAKHLDDGHRGEILREGFRVALLGAPNAGKSSLLNALARRDAAIVSEEAGTTRDVIEVRLDLNGLPVILSDTAGIRETQGTVEREGIRRSLEAARDAQLVLWLSETGFDSPCQEISRETSLEVRTKIDLESLHSPLGEKVAGHRGASLRDDGRMRGRALRDESQNSPLSPSGEGASIAISAKTGEGIDALIAEITRRASHALGDGSGAPVITQARHRRHLETAAAALDTFLAGDVDAFELRAEDLRQAAHALGRITGRVDVEDVLGEIFSRFCIGK